MSSVTFLGTSQRDRALECENRTGASETAIAARIVSSEVCDRSTSVAHRFSSRTTSSPKRVNPPWVRSPVAESAQSVSSLCVRVT